MTRFYLLLCALTAFAASSSAQNRDLAPYTSAALTQKRVQLDKAFSAFRAGAMHDGLLIMAEVHAFDPTDEDVTRLYRLNANRYAIRVAEDCDLEVAFSNCDSALRYVQLARRLGDSSVYHEVRAQALYQKLQHLEESDFNAHREKFQGRSMTRDVGYRYLPEERRIFFRNLINETIGEISVARGELDRKEKIDELLAKVKIIERSQRMVGTR